MLDFFDFYLIGFVLAFIVGGWHLTYGQSGAILLSLRHRRAARFAVLGLDGGQDRPPQGHDPDGAQFLHSPPARWRSPPTGLALPLSICRFFVGLGVTGLYTVDIAIVQEFVPASKRGWLTGLTTSCCRPARCWAPSAGLS